MTRATTAIAHACRWPGCPYEASARLKTARLASFAVCVKHAAEWHQLTYEQMVDVHARLQPPRTWTVSSAASPAGPTAYG